MAKVVDRDDYFLAAIDLLAEADHGGLKQSALCKRLKVTTGSFYNYFGSWAEFKTELLQYWLDVRTLQLAETARAATESADMLETLVDFACNLPHPAEAAIRAWSHSDHEVRRVQDIVDTQRFAVAHEAMLRVSGDKSVADYYAAVGVLLLNGYQQSRPLRDISILRRALNDVFREVINAGEDGSR